LYRTPDSFGFIAYKKQATAYRPMTRQRSKTSLYCPGTDLRHDRHMLYPQLPRILQPINKWHQIAVLKFNYIHVGQEGCFTRRRISVCLSR